MLFKFEVIADSSGKFCGNAQTFGTKDAAIIAARDLERRWMLVREWRVLRQNEATTEWEVVSKD